VTPGTLTPWPHHRHRTSGGQDSGKVEGTVNKIKMIKRQMYGRAGFDLLRKRVILHPA
jgi:transposase